MEGINWILLNHDSVREAIEEYLNRRHSKDGRVLSVDSWGVQTFNGTEWCACEVTESAPGAEVK